MQSHRLFLGSYINTDSLRNLYYPLQKEFSNFCRGKWVELENLHFTYHFIGEVDSAKAIEIKKSLSLWLNEIKSEITLSGLGLFPNRKNPKVIFINIFNEDGTLSKIYERTSLILENFDYTPERKLFKPHLTLMRIKEINGDGFYSLLKKYEDYFIDSIESFKVELIQSTLTPTGPIYKIF